jgi:hypothetical protein
MSVRKLWRLWLLGLVAVVLTWLALQDPLSSSDVQAVGEARPGARLPTVAPPPRPVDPAPALAALSQSALWGPLAPRAASGAGGDAGAEMPPPQWSLSGYYENTGTRFVIVSFEQQVLPSRQLRVADRLPDGSRIEQIEPDRVRVRRPPPSSADEAASSPESSWLPITPGLPAPATKNQRSTQARSAR